jgi:hypothetical protein
VLTLFSIIGCMVFIGALVFAGLYLYVEFMDWRLRQYCLKHLVFKEAKSVKEKPDN